MSDEPLEEEPLEEELGEEFEGIDVGSLGELAPGALPPAEQSPEEAQGAAKKAAQESAKAAEKQKGDVAGLKAETLEGKDEDGNCVKVSRIAVISSQVRQSVVQVLRQIDPEGYEGYKGIKFKGCPLDSDVKPPLEQRKAAYRYAFSRFLEATYTKPGV